MTNGKHPHKNPAPATAPNSESRSESGNVLRNSAGTTHPSPLGRDSEHMQKAGNMTVGRGAVDNANRLGLSEWVHP